MLHGEEVTAVKCTGKCQLQEVIVPTIKSNSMLELSIEGSDVERQAKSIQSVGLLTPMVLWRDHKGEHRVLFGERELQALRKLKSTRTDAVVIAGVDKVEANKLSLLLLSFRNSSDALSEGLIIKDLLTNPKINQSDVALMVGRSISWVSKRVSLVARLSDSVVDQVARKLIVPRTAQEIAKLPSEIQPAFALRVIQDRMSKATVERLVALYNDPSSSETLRKEILSAPQDTLRRFSRRFHAIKTEEKPTEERIGEKFCASLRLLVQLLAEIETMYALLPCPEKLTSSFLQVKEPLIRLLQLLALLPSVEFAPGQTPDKKVVEA